MRCRKGVVASFLLLALGLPACSDHELSTGVAVRPTYIVRPTSPSLQFDPVPGGLVSLSITNSTSPAATAQLPALNKKLLLRVTLSGSVDIALNPPYNDGTPNQPQIPGAPRSVGPAGFYYPGSIAGCGVQLQAGYGSSGGGTSFALGCNSNKSTDGTAQAIGYIYSAGAPVGQNAYGSFIRSGGNPNEGQCASYPPTGFTGYGPCFRYSTSGQTVLLERAVGDLSLDAFPSQVNYGDTVRVVASVTPGSLGGLELPWSIDSVQWTTVAGMQISPCGTGSFTPTTSGPTRTCKTVFKRSGVMRVKALVNGEWKDKSVTITVTPPKLKLTAVPGVIQSAAPVTFTATVTPTTSVWWAPSWDWKPDAGTGGISSNCQWMDNPCTRTISKSGWMKVTTSFDGYSLVDSARVYVVPCPPIGDGSLDDPGLRSALNNEQVASKGEQLERGGVIVRNLATGRDSLVAIASLLRAACFVGWPAQFPAYSGYRVVAFWHTHWAPTNYPCFDTQGNQYPAGKGLSRGDWHSAYTMQCPLYTVDDEHIWRINPTLLSQDANWDRKRPPREIERSPSTTKCKTWPASLPYEEDPSNYTC